MHSKNYSHEFLQYIRWFYNIFVDCIIRMELAIHESNREILPYEFQGVSSLVDCRVIWIIFITNKSSSNIIWWVNIWHKLIKMNSNNLSMRASSKIFRHYDWATISIKINFSSCIHMGLPSKSRTINCVCYFLSPMTFGYHTPKNRDA